MKIKDKFKETEDIQSFWRGQILTNYALLQCHQWFALLSKPRPAVKIGEETVDAGDPLDKVCFYDIHNLHFGLNPVNIIHECKLHEFFEWFLDLEEETFEEEDEDGVSNWLDFQYMARAWNFYIMEEND